MPRKTVYICECCNTEGVQCSHCNKVYEPTTDNFYTANGKLKLDKCKTCKKELSRINGRGKPRKNKQIDTRDRKEYMKEYYRRRKEAKLSLKST